MKCRELQLQKMPQACGGVLQYTARHVQPCGPIPITLSLVGVRCRHECMVPEFYLLGINPRHARDSEFRKVVVHAEKLSPQEQWATAFGFVTLNPPFCKSSLKSSSDPLTKSALLGSTTTRT